MYDVLIINGKVIDGTGNPWFRADVGIQGDTIVAVGQLDTRNADLIVDAEDSVVCPGFIDIHTHSDYELLVDGKADSHIRQGVTTNVIGNCGTSAAPISPVSRKHLKIDYPGLEIDWTSMDEYLTRLETQGISVNVAALVGQGTVRCAVMGFKDGPPTSEELEAMQDLVRVSMEEGAFGLSSGLIYVPGCYASTEELISLAEICRSHNGSYHTHMRGENDTLLEAIAEAVQIGRKAGIPVQISHFKAMGRHMWGKSADAIELLDQARDEGIDITCDQYPYNASATGLGAYLPSWAHVGGTESLLARLKDANTRGKIKRDILHGLPGWISLYKGVGWENTIITYCSKHDLEGKSISQIARERGTDDFETAFDILTECDGQVSVVYFTIGDEDIERIMRYPLTMVGSDSSAISTEGPLAIGKPHPRSFGTFARVLGYYVREKKVITLQDAIRKMTSLPAQRMRFYDRGLLKAGMKADLVVFDPNAVRDMSTYTEPFAYPQGINYVIVNGKLTVEHGEHLGTKAGRVLRSC